MLARKQKLDDVDKKLKYEDRFRALGYVLHSCNQYDIRDEKHLKLEYRLDIGDGSYRFIRFISVTERVSVGEIDIYGNQTNASFNPSEIALIQEQIKEFGWRS